LKQVISNPSVAGLEFSHYLYTPQSIADHRYTFELSREQFVAPAIVERVIASTPPEYELAMHSKVRLWNGGTLHIPMVDMSTSAKAHLPKLQNFIENVGFGAFVWYSSGRSFHGYGNRLLNQEEWVGLMGTLLLSNQKGMMPTVDPRWIGHRLLAGYSALRWSKNTFYYLNTPALLPQAR
jgi:hypothetical protein